MCVETKNEFDRWTSSIRIAKVFLFHKYYGKIVTKDGFVFFKFGQQLKVNYLLMEKAMNLYRSSGRTFIFTYEYNNK